MKKLSTVIFSILLLFLAGLVFPAPKKVNAQLSSVGVASYLPIINSKVEDGDIISTADKGYVLSNTTYDTRMIGVVSINPAISLKTDGVKNGYPVVSAGTAYVKVSGTGGAIKKGNYITSSTVMGTGMRAAGNGYVIGEALTDVSFSKKDEIKLLQVMVDPHSVQNGSSVSNSLFDILNLSKATAFEQPSKTLQYVLAAIIILASFGCGFLIFAKAVNTGLEALGRNPLAGRMIQLSIVFNLILIVVVVMAGITLAYLVLRL